MSDNLNFLFFSSTKWLDFVKKLTAQISKIFIVTSSIQIIYQFCFTVKYWRELLNVNEWFDQNRLTVNIRPKLYACDHVDLRVKLPKRWRLITKSAGQCTFTIFTKRLSLYSCSSLSEVVFCRFPCIKLHNKCVCQNLNAIC